LLTGETDGELLYHEQAMRIAIEVAGYEEEDSARFLRVIKISRSTDIEKERELFIRGAVARHGINNDDAANIFDLVRKSSGTDKT
jgi:DNA polymerase-3 subunit alpha